MAAPPGQFIALQAFNALNETILGYGMHDYISKFKRLGGNSSNEVQLCMKYITNI